MKRLVGMVVLVMAGLVTKGQLWEDFSDGNFSHNPEWNGSALNWLVNPDLRLQSQSAVANSSFQLTTENAMATETEWEFWIRLQFNTSSSNYVDVFLVASQADLTAASTTGYFVRIGNTQDEVSLYRKDIGSSTRIIDGTDGISNTSDNILRIKVIRDAQHRFHLFRDLTGTGNHYVKEGMVDDQHYLTSSFFGFLVRQSTSGFFGKHFFDDISIKTYVPDQDPPLVNSVQAIEPNRLEIWFSEPVSNASAVQLQHYALLPQSEHPVHVEHDAGFPARVRLGFATSFPPGQLHQLWITSIQDLAGNTMTGQTVSFSWSPGERFEVVITEIMADPAPPQGLPNAEYIEIKNRSGRTISLQGWYLQVNQQSSGLLPALQLQPDSFLILTTASQVQQFQAYGATAALPNFPALPNAGAVLALVSKEGKTIHTVSYSDAWYNNSLKKEGGWSLEMVDVQQPCLGRENWKASTHPKGGTPGSKNSVSGIVEDQLVLEIQKAYLLHPQLVEIVFNKPVDSLQAANISLYSTSLPLTILQARAVAPLFDRLQLELAQAIQPGQLLQVTIKNLNDCNGKEIGSRNKITTALGEVPMQGDIVINEILFNPRPGGSDFVECYNAGTKAIDLSSLFINNRNSNGLPGTPRKLSATRWIILPGEYVVFTDDPANLQLQYHVKDPGVVAALALPSFPDDKGTVILLDDQGNTIDEVSYSDKWHFPLLKEKEAVSLEKIDPAAPSGESSSWHSAASSAGFATPGYQNSQYRITELDKAIVSAAPKVISPDMDGRDDFLTISYQLPEPGYMLNLFIFNAAGQQVRYLVKNQLLGLKGSFRWDGLDEKGSRLPSGHYILLSEIFSLKGERKQFKEVIIIAPH